VRVAGSNPVVRSQKITRPSAFSNLSLTMGPAIHDRGHGCASRRRRGHSQAGAAPVDPAPATGKRSPNRALAGARPTGVGRDALLCAAKKARSYNENRYRVIDRSASNCAYLPCVSMHNQPVYYFPGGPTFCVDNERRGPISALSGYRPIGGAPPSSDCPLSCSVANYFRRRSP